MYSLHPNDALAAHMPKNQMPSDYWIYQVFDKIKSWICDLVNVIPGPDICIFAEALNRTYSATQSTVAQLMYFVPTLEAAFKAAGIRENESWPKGRSGLLNLLEAETEAVREEHILALQLESPVKGSW